MEFAEESNRNLRKYARALGFAASYFISTTLLFLVLSYTRKLPADWSYLSVMFITASIAAAGALIKRWEG